MHARQAVVGLQNNPVDLLFLDINMPGMSGLELLQNLPNPPVTVLVTGFNEHALEAFHLGVRDYLLKPVSPERLATCISRILPLLQTSKDEHRLALPCKLAFPVGREYQIFPLQDILSFDAEGNFSLLVTAKQRTLVSESLKAIEARLALFGFRRVHKSYLVNTDRIVSYDGRDLIFDTGMKRPIGRSYQNEFRNLHQSIALSSLNS